MLIGPEVTTLEGVRAELNEVRAGRDYNEFSYILGSKLALVVHSLLHHAGQMGECEASGIQYLIEEIQEGISNMGKFSGTAQDYIGYTSDPDSLAEIQGIERKLASLR